MAGRQRERARTDAREETGARRRALVGRLLPRVELPIWPDGTITLSAHWAGPESLVLVLDAGAGSSDDEALGYLTRLRAWNKRASDFDELGYAVALLVADQPIKQRQLLRGTAWAVTVICDERLVVAEHLQLPTSRSATRRIYQSTTLLVHGGEIGEVIELRLTSEEDVDLALRAVREIADRAI